MIQMVNEFVVVPALQIAGIYSEDRADLILAIGAAESLYQHNKQVSGPALGWWQMEPATHDDIWKNVLNHSKREPIVMGLSKLSKRPGYSKELEYNPWYAAAMCGVHFLRFKKKLPAAGFRTAQADYWKKYYNTAHGKGTIGGFLEKTTEILGE